jgi:DNA repair protein RadA/Sms
MVKKKRQFVCQSCGHVASQWVGLCAGCQKWNTLLESVEKSSNPRATGYAGEVASDVVVLDQVDIVHQTRMDTGSEELNRVLGGGVVLGSVVLLGGDPGIGKSTLILQTLAQLSQQCPALYVTGEESLQQVSMRAKRLGLDGKSIHLLAETHVERIIDKVMAHQASFVVIDSIQTLFSQEVSSAPGSVSQVRECAARLVHFAKARHVALVLIGHVTKEGALAGPRVLEHMVDTVLYFESGGSPRFRAIRAVKNRFGAVNELGMFAMMDHGLKAVTNPSSIFLSHYQSKVSGSVVMATWEGSRPLLVEMQALVDTSHLPQPRRVSVGLDQQRMNMLLAILHKHGGIASYDQDVFVNVVGGMRISETGSDCAIVLAIVSSLKNRPLPDKMLVFGELGLSGEVRPVAGGQDRVLEAAKHGFETVVIPKANVDKKVEKSVKQVIAISHLQDLLALI